MNNQIIHLSKEEFCSQGVLNLKLRQYTFNNLIFREENKFSLEESQTASDICRQYAIKNLKTIIVKSQSNLTIWVENNVNVAQHEAKLAEKTTASEALDTETEATEPKSGLINKIAKAYRGQSHEIDEPIVEKKHQKPRRKYRGHYID